MDAETFRLLGALFALVFPVLSACGGDDETTGSPDPGKEPMNKSVEVPAEMFLAAAPSGAIGVREALTTAKAGEEIVVRAVIGGRKKPGRSPESLAEHGPTLRLYAGLEDVDELIADLESGFDRLGKNGSTR